MTVMNVHTEELNYAVCLFVGRKKSGAQSPPKQCDLKTDRTSPRNRNDSRVTRTGISCLEEPLDF